MSGGFGGKILRDTFYYRDGSKDKQNFAKSGRYNNDDWSDVEEPYDDIGRSRAHNDIRKSRMYNENEDDFGFDWMNDANIVDDLSKSKSTSNLRDTRQVYTGSERENPYGVSSPYSRTITATRESSKREYGRTHDDKKLKRELSTIAESGIYDGAEGQFRLDDIGASRGGVGKPALGVSMDYGRSTRYDDNKYGSMSSFRSDDSISLDPNTWRGRVLSPDTKQFFENQWVLPLRCKLGQGSDAFSHNRSNDYGPLPHRKDSRPRRFNVHRLPLILLVVSLLACVGVAIAVVFVFVTAPSATDSKPVGGEAKLEVTLNTTLTDALSQANSTERQAFEEDFCTQMLAVYNNDQSAVKNMDPKCKVDSLRSGSIIVIFVITVTGDTSGITDVTFKEILDTVLVAGTSTEPSITIGNLTITVEAIVVVTFTPIITTTTTTTTQATRTMGTTTTTTQQNTTMANTATTAPPTTTKDTITNTIDTTATVMDTTTNTMYTTTTVMDTTTTNTMDTTTTVMDTTTTNTMDTTTTNTMDTTATVMDTTTTNNMDTTTTIMDTKITNSMDTTTTNTMDSTTTNGTDITTTASTRMTSTAATSSTTTSPTTATTTSTPTQTTTSTTTTIPTTTTTPTTTITSSTTTIPTTAATQTTTTPTTPTTQTTTTTPVSTTTTPTTTATPTTTTTPKTTIITSTTTTTPPTTTTTPTATTSTPTTNINQTTTTISTTRTTTPTITTTPTTTTTTTPTTTTPTTTTPTTTTPTTTTPTTTTPTTTTPTTTTPTITTTTVPIITTPITTTPPTTTPTTTTSTITTNTTPITTTPTTTTPTTTTPTTTTPTTTTPSTSTPTTTAPTTITTTTPTTTTPTTPTPTTTAPTITTPTISTPITTIPTTPTPTTTTPTTTTPITTTPTTTTPTTITTTTPTITTPTTTIQTTTTPTTTTPTTTTPTKTTLTTTIPTTTTPTTTIPTPTIPTTTTEITTTPTTTAPTTNTPTTTTPTTTTPTTTTPTVTTPTTTTPTTTTPITTTPTTTTPTTITTTTPTITTPTTTIQTTTTPTTTTPTTTTPTKTTLTTTIQTTTTPTTTIPTPTIPTTTTEITTTPTTTAPTTNTPTTTTPTTTTPKTTTPTVTTPTTTTPTTTTPTTTTPTVTTPTTTTPTTTAPTTTTPTTTTPTTTTPTTTTPTVTTPTTTTPTTTAPTTTTPTTTTEITTTPTTTTPTTTTPTVTTPTTTTPTVTTPTTTTPITTTPTITTPTITTPTATTTTTPTITTPTTTIPTTITTSSTATTTSITTTTPTNTTTPLDTTTTPNTTTTQTTTTTPTITTTESTSTTPAITTTMFVPPVITMNDVTALVYQPLAMTCIVNNLPDNWTSLVLSSDVRGPIATLPYTGTVLEHAPSTFAASGDRSSTAASLNVTLDGQSSHCNDKGIFTCTLVSQTRENFTDTAVLALTAHPTSTLVAASSYSEGAVSAISCVGVLPAGTGTLSLYVKSPGGSEFTQFNTVTPTITDGSVTSNCTVNRTVTYTFTPTLQFNGTEAKCVANNSALTGSSASSTAQVIVVNKADIAFNAYDRREEVGSTDIVIGCNVRNAPGWSNVLVTRQTTGSTSATTIFSLDKGETADQPLSPRATYVHTADDSSLSVTLTLSTLNCEDRGEYICTATGTSSPLTTNMTFDIYKNPGTPILTLNPDQIENLGFHRDGFEHQCLAETGFPEAGSLAVVYRVKGQTSFAPFQGDRIIQYDTNTTNTSCGTTRYFKFGLNFTSMDEGGEVKCVVTNKALGVTTESAVGTLELIPRHYCNTTNTPAHLHHPTSCNKYVQCLSRYPYGSQCPSVDQCANIGDVVTCGSCDGVICPWNITTTTQGPTTTTLPPPSSQFINCSDARVFLGNPAALTCNITGAFNYINVTKATRSIADVISDGTVVNRNLKTGEQVVFSQSRLTIAYDIAECDDDGQFTVDVHNTGGTTESQAVALDIRAKPHSVSMVLTDDLIEGIDRRGSENVCEGYVGNPAGQLEVTMTKPGDATVYSVPLANYDGSRGSTITLENCNYKARLEFGLELGLEWQNGTITCRAKNSDVFQEGDTEKNDTATLHIIPDGYCAGEPDNQYKVNPYSCNKYVQCANDLPYGKGCGSQCFTGNQFAPLCAGCQTIQCSLTPTTTTSTTPSTTTLPPDVYATCNSVNNMIGGAATLTCTVNKNTYSYINVTFSPRDSQTSNHVVDILPGTEVVNDNSGTGRSVTVANGDTEINIAFASLACTDEGDFHLNVFSGSEVSSTTASVSVRDIPKSNPTLTSAQRIATGHELSPAINCSGDTGYASGAINLQMKLSGTSSFVNVTDFTKRETSSTADCVETKQALYNGAPTVAMNGSLIRCATNHPDTGDVLVSAEELFYVIDGTMCIGKTGMFYHPHNCGLWVTCSQNAVFVNHCGSDTPCIKLNETSASGFCATTCTHCPSYQTFIPGNR